MHFRLWLVDFKNGSAFTRHHVYADAKAVNYVNDYFAAVSIYTPITHPEIAQRWFALPNLIYFSPVPILVVLFSGLILHACKQRHEIKPFVYYAGIGFSGHLLDL